MSGTCATYLILIYLPLIDGGGKASMSGSITSLSLEVPIFALRLRYTCLAVSSTLKMRCLVRAEAKMMGKSTNGAIRLRMAFSKVLMTSCDLSSTRSHLLTTTTRDLLFFWMSWNIFISCASIPRVASSIRMQTSLFSIERIERITE